MLVLDETTSLLDSETELRISKAIRNLKGKVTMAVIAHRSSTVRKTDHVYCLEDEKIKSSGSFEEVCKKSLDSDKHLNYKG